MELKWTSSVQASALYGVLALGRGQKLIEPAVATRLAPVLAALAGTLAAADCLAEPLLSELVGLAADFDLPFELAEAALEAAFGRELACQLGPAVAEAISSATRALIAARPRLAEELPLRREPLRSQWEARGPGLLAGLGRLLGNGPLVPAAEVVLVQPVLGGGGAVHARLNRVTFEAVLANPLAELPEVLRLGWLLGQLNLGLPSRATPAGAGRLDDFGPLALVPAVLTAAADIELARDDRDILRLALDAWLGAEWAADLLAAWWQNYLAARPAWPTALATLAALIDELPSA